MGSAKRLAKRIVGPSEINESFIAYAVLKGRRGVMVDVGAHFGSSLEPFAEAGWSVHAFEPDPNNRTKLEEAFGHHGNVTIVPKGVSDEEGQAPLYGSSESTGISSLTPFTEGHEPVGLIELTTLSDYLRSAGVGEIDFLKVDVEGFERNVLRGHDWSVKPEVVVVEFEDSKTIPLGYSWKDLADELVSRGYEVLVSEWFPVERYGTSHRWRRFARYPTELEHPDAWGNLIAARSLEAATSAGRRAVMRARVRRGIEKVVRGTLGAVRGLRERRAP